MTSLLLKADRGLDYRKTPEATLKSPDAHDDIVNLLVLSKHWAVGKYRRNRLMLLFFKSGSSLYESSCDVGSSQELGFTCGAQVPADVEVHVRQTA